MNLVSSPWENTYGKAVKQRVIAVLLLFIAVIGLSALFSSASARAEDMKPMVVAAPANSNQKCERIIYAGDKSANEVKSKLPKGNDGVQVLYITGEKTGTEELVSQLKSQNITSKDCVIIDTGIKNALELNSGKATSAEVKKSIGDVLDELKKANSVTWVSPIVSDSNKTSTNNPDEFNKILKEKAKEYPNTEILDISKVGKDGKNFKDDGYTMTDDGYTKRLAEIFKQAKDKGDIDLLQALLKLLEGSDDLLKKILEILGMTKDQLTGTPTPTPKPTPTPTPTPTSEKEDTDNPSNPSNPNNPGGPGSWGGSGDSATINNYDSSQNSPQVGGQDAQSLALGTPSSDMPSGDIPPGTNVQDSSPRAVAQRVKAATDYRYVNRYLIANRWGNLNIPISGFNPLAGGDIMNSSIATICKVVYASLSSFASIVLAFLSLAFGTTFGTMFLQIGDGIFGSTIGGMFSGQGGVARASAFISALVTITIVSAGFSVFDTHNAGRDMKSRLLSVLGSVAKVIVAFIVFTGVGIQSAKNNSMAAGPGGGDTQEIIDTVVRKFDTSKGILPGNTKDTSGVQLDSNGKITEKTLKVKSPSLADTTSWKPLSLGWITSFFFEICNWVINSVMEVINSVTIYPLAALGSSIESKTKDPTGKSLPSCDRYVDSIHYAYTQSAASRKSEVFAQLIVGVDNVYSRLVMKPYALTYGDTLSGNNVWCHQLENDNNIDSGEILMLARSAGLYAEVAGAGNLLGDRPHTYTDGSHKMGDMKSTLRPNAYMATKSDGLFVDPAGNWKPMGENGTDSTPMRAAVYLGKASMKTNEQTSGAKASDTAFYYFAACEWDANKGQTMANRDWRGKVKAMPSDDKDHKPKNHASMTEKEADEVYKDPEKRIAPEAAGPLEASRQEMKPHLSDDEKKAGSSQFIQDFDCKMIGNFPIGDKEGKDDFGWGANNRISDRWYYAPGNANLLTQTSKRWIGSLPPGLRTVADFGFRQMAPEEHSKAERDENAESSFAGSMDHKDQRNYAMDFWKASNGHGNASHTLGALWVAGSVWIIVVLFMLIPALLGAIVNFIFGIIIMIVPGIIMIQLFMKAINGGSGKKK